MKLLQYKSKTSKVSEDITTNWVISYIFFNHVSYSVLMSNDCIFSITLLAGCWTGYRKRTFCNNAIRILIFYEILLNVLLWHRKEENVKKKKEAGEKKGATEIQRRSAGGRWREGEILSQNLNGVSNKQTPILGLYPGTNAETHN